MSEKTWRAGSVHVSVGEDGSIQVYAPESNRRLAPEVAVDLLAFLYNSLPHEEATEAALARLAEPAPAELGDPETLTERLNEAGDRLASRLEADESVKPAPKRPGRPRKTS